MPRSKALTSRAIWKEENPGVVFNPRKSKNIPFKHKISLCIDDTTAHHWIIYSDRFNPIKATCKICDKSWQERYREIEDVIQD